LSSNAYLTSAICLSVSPISTRAAAANFQRRKMENKRKQKRKKKKRETRIIFSDLCRSWIALFYYRFFIDIANIN
jgi:hypothetical protein